MDHPILAVRAFFGSVGLSAISLSRLAGLSIAAIAAPTKALELLTDPRIAAMATHQVSDRHGRDDRQALLRDSCVCGAGATEGSSLRNQFHELCVQAVGIGAVL